MSSSFSTIHRPRISAAVASFLTMVLCAGASSSSDLSQALAEGEFGISLRYRFEYVDDDAFDERAGDEKGGTTSEASTLRTTLAYRSAAFRGWTVFVEAENITAIPDDDTYANAGSGSLDNGVTGRPVVADPELTEINQAYLRYQRGVSTGTLGRQEINLGDQRFVGAVGWRQNHQSFDAFRVQTKFGEGQPDRGVGLDYSYLHRVNRIFGDRRDLDGHALWVPIGLGAKRKLTAYGLWLDFDSAAALSTATFGLELAGKGSLAPRFGLSYELEIAQQDDHADNPTNVDAQYLLASVEFDLPAVDVGVAWESLGGEAGKGAFKTPLATLHKWNGWADKFLNTPAPGLETIYLRLRGKVGERLSWTVVWHDFQSDSGDLDYGTELDAELVYRSTWDQVFALKLASYDAEDFSTDTDKLMFSTSYKF